MKKQKNKIEDVNSKFCYLLPSMISNFKNSKIINYVENNSKYNKLLVMKTQLEEYRQKILNECLEKGIIDKEEFFLEIM